MLSIGGKFDTPQYADKDGLTGWETPEDENLKKAMEICNSWANRNALHVDVDGQVGETKKVFQRLWDSLKGIKDDDSDQGGGPFKMGIKGETIADGTSMRDHPFINLDDDLCSFDSEILGEEQIYSPGKGVEGIKFVRLNDKEKYIKESREFLKEAVRKFLISGKSGEEFKYSYFFKSIKEGQLEFNPIIGKEDIILVIKKFLFLKSNFIVSKVSCIEDFNKLSNQNKKLFMWFYNNYISVYYLFNDSLIEPVDFGDTQLIGPSDSFQSFLHMQGIIEKLFRKGVYVDTFYTEFDLEKQMLLRLGFPGQGNNGTIKEEIKGGVKGNIILSDEDKIAAYLKYKAEDLYDRYLRLKDNGEDIGSDFIVTFESTLEENNELHIFAYGLKNGFITEIEFAEIIFDDTSETMESFLAKYGDSASIERICNELLKEPS